MLYAFNVPFFPAYDLFIVFLISFPISVCVSNRLFLSTFLFSLSLNSFYIFLSLKFSLSLVFSTFLFLPFTFLSLLISWISCIFFCVCLSMSIFLGFFVFISFSLCLSFCQLVFLSVSLHVHHQTIYSSFFLFSIEKRIHLKMLQSTHFLIYFSDKFDVNYRFALG